jgi:multidrug efflux pump subunit AcrB
MNFRNISAWSIRNPVVPIVLFVALTLAGIMAFRNMDVQNDPDIEFPVVVVSISQPGASPTEITTQITQKVESAIRSVQGVRNIDASANEGNTSVSAEFEIGDDINAAVSEVKNAVDQIRGDLPDGILEPQVFKVATSSDPIAYFAVEASDMTLEQLSWFVDDTVSRRLLAVEGMASVSRNGGVNREIRVILDPAKMQSLGVTASQINGVLRQQNLNAAGGQAEIAGSRQSVRILGNAANAYELGQSQISLGGGRSVKLADVAEVTDGYSEQRSMAFESGRQVVTFGMSRAKGASDVTVFDNATEVMQQIEKENPGIKFTTLFNSVAYTKAQYKSSMAAMIEGALLAIVVVFLFLRDWRATIISAIAIPLSAIPTFWFLDLLGFTLNTMSLLEYRPPHADGQIGLSGVDRCRGRDWACGCRDHLLDRRGLPAGWLDAGRRGPVLQEFRPDGRCIGADEPCRCAHDHADDRRLFPEIGRHRRAWRRPDDGPLYEVAPLVYRQQQSGSA